MEDTDADPADRKLADALERLANGLRRHDQTAATRAGLTPLQLRLLRAAAAVPGERRRVGALAAEVQVSQPTASDALAALEAKGLIARRASPADRRGSSLAPTPLGRRLLRRSGGPPRALLDALGQLAPDAKAHTLETLLAVIAGLHRGGVITVARTCSTCRFFAPGRHPGSAAPHHCLLLDQPPAGGDLRVDCPEHEPAVAASGP